MYGVLSFPLLFIFVRGVNTTLLPEILPGAQGADDGYGAVAAGRAGRVFCAYGQGKCASG